jgi:hypothetical protein
MRTLHLTQTIDLETEAGRYLMSCARIRDVAVTALVSRLVKRITEDQLILAILDDDSKRSRGKMFLKRREKHFRELL